MQNEKLLNRIFAGVAFLLSFIVYLKTIAPTTSFWDCGEFITCSYILGIPHPPGAPFYLLLGRLFTMVPFAADIGLRVNVISALASSITVMFTYLIIVRLIKQWRGEPKKGFDIVVLIASGLIGSLTFAFTDTFWFNAVEAEVYAISMFFTSIILWLILVWLEKSDQEGSERYLLIIAYLVGLAIGVHLLMILTLPAIFMIVYYKYLDRTGQKINIINLGLFAIVTAATFFIIYPGIVQFIPNLAGKTSIWFLLFILIAVVLGIYFGVSSNKKILSLALMAALLILIGYSTYTMIYIRSGLNPAIDENDPENMEKMVKYLNREQYGKISTFPRLYPGLPQPWQFKQEHPYEKYATFEFGKQMDFFWEYQVKKMYLRYFSWQFVGKGTTLGKDGFIVENFTTKGLLGLPFLIGLLGMVHHFYKHRRHAFMVLALFFLTGVAIVIYLNQPDPQPRERDYVFVGSFFAFAIWIGMGITAILEWIEEAMRGKKQMIMVLSIAIIAAFTVMGPVNLLAYNYKDHDRTGNYVAYDYSYNILQTCEPNAIVFTNGDNDTFPLWFLQYVYNIRPDVRVVNLSLLNTPWYIKQLKHQDPKVPISLPDNEIESLELVRWEKKTVKIPVTTAAKQHFSEVDDTQHLFQANNAILDELTVDVEPTLFGQALRVQDYMILNIIFANQWRKPVYFAVTVSDDNKLNFNKYLRMDGLNFKLVPTDRQPVSTEKLEKNLFEIFQFRGLNDPNVFFNDNIKGLLQNYRAAFLRLANEYIKKGQNDKVIAVLDRMNEVMPEDIIPYPDFRIMLQIGQMYDNAGKTEEFIKRAEKCMEIAPDNPLSIGTLISLYSREGYHDKSVKLLEDWAQRHPADSRALQMLEAERALLAKTDSLNKNDTEPDQK